MDVSPFGGKTENHVQTSDSDALSSKFYSIRFEQMKHQLQSVTKTHMERTTGVREVSQSMG